MILISTSVYLNIMNMISDFGRRAAGVAGEFFVFMAGPGRPDRDRNGSRNKGCRDPVSPICQKLSFSWQRKVRLSGTPAIFCRAARRPREAGDVVPIGRVNSDCRDTARSRCDPLVRLPAAKKE